MITLVRFRSLTAHIAVLSVSLSLAGCNAPVRSPTEPKDAHVTNGTLATADVPSDRGGLITYINALIAKGDQESTTQAMVLINERFTADEIRDNAEVHGLLDRAMAADKLAGKSSRDDEYAGRVASTWLPQVAQIGTDLPTTPEELWKCENEFEELARAVSDGAEFKSGAGAQARDKLRRSLIAKQREVFPILRKAYGLILGKVMWPMDVEVVTTGTGHRAMSFIGGRFAANQNIADAYNGVREHLAKLRFKRSTFAWLPGASGYAYVVASPGDDAIGTWEGGNFTEVAD